MEKGIAINDGVVVLSQGNKDFIWRNMPKVIGSQDGVAHTFDPDRIKHSILKETTIKKDCPKNWELVADKITAEVCEVIMDLYINKKYTEVTARYVRELVCGALQNINRKWRSQYTTMGIPWADFKNGYGYLFDEIENWEDVTPHQIYDLIIPKMNSIEIIELICKMARDYIGVRNDIKDFEAEEK